MASLAPTCIGHSSTGAGAVLNGKSAACAAPPIVTSAAAARRMVFMSSPRLIVVDDRGQRLRDFAPSIP